MAEILPNKIVLPYKMAKDDECAVCEEQGKTKAQLEIHKEM